MQAVLLVAAAQQWRRVARAAAAARPTPELPLKGGPHQAGKVPRLDITVDTTQKTRETTETTMDLGDLGEEGQEDSMHTVRSETRCLNLCLQECADLGQHGFQARGMQIRVVVT